MIKKRWWSHRGRAYLRAIFIIVLVVKKERIQKVFGSSCVYVCILCLSRVSFSISYFESIVLLMIYAASMFTWCPHAKPVAKRPNTKNGCAAAWYFTSFLIGSGKKNLNCAKICGAIKQNKTLE